MFDASNGPILQFFSLGDDGNIYRISYTLVVPVSGAVAQRYWTDANWQPCEVLYSRERWTDLNSDVVPDSNEYTWVVNSQPITDQVVTNLTIARPSWSGKVVQIMITVSAKGTYGNATESTRIAQVALRQ